LAEDYWGNGYWGTGYWGLGYWGQGGTGGVTGGDSHFYYYRKKQKPTDNKELLTSIRELLRSLKE